MFFPSQGSTTAVAAQLDTRVWTPLTKLWPLKLLIAVNLKFTQDARRCVRDEFYNVSRCCHDEFFSQPFVEAVPNVDQFGSVAVQSFLQRKLRDLKLLNMSMEGTLAKFKKAVVRPRGPDIEKRMGF